jgi:hypothetical protein
VSVSHLTKQEQIVLCVVIGLLLTGWAVKAYRQAHPPVAATLPVGGAPAPATADQTNF